MRTKDIGEPAAGGDCMLRIHARHRNWKRLIPFWIPAAIYGFYGIRFQSAATSQPLYDDLGSGQAVALGHFILRDKYVRTAVPQLLLAFALFVTRDRRLSFALGAIVFKMGIYS